LPHQTDAEERSAARLDRHKPGPAAMTKLPKNMPALDEILIKTDSLPWREKSLKGIHEKMLWRNEETGASIALIKFVKGAGIAQPHYHASNQFMFCLTGCYEYTSTGVVLTPGSFYCNPKGNVHGPAIAHEETVVVEIYDGPHYLEMPAWYTDEQDAR
jgi:2,4'-dihydroxyacetophenone dioxygenase